MSRTLGRLLAACAWLALAAAATAQVPDDPEEEGAGLKADVVQIPDFDIEQWIFGNTDAAGARKRLETALSQDIQRFERKYALTATQKKKLELAGRHDIKRFFDRVADVKLEYDRNKGDWNKVGNRVFELQRVHNQPHSELFGEDSMLAKTLRKNLTPEQLARNDRTNYRGRVEWMAGLLHSRLVLSLDQRRKFVDLVVRETPPLKRYGDFDYDAIMYQISRVPREKLRTVLDESQCRELSLRFAQARRMESILVSEGYLAGAGGGAGELNAHHEEARR